MANTPPYLVRMTSALRVRSAFANRSPGFRGVIAVQTGKQLVSVLANVATERPGGGPKMDLVATEVNQSYVEPRSVTNFRDCI